MSLGYAVPLRNAQLDAIATFAGNGAILRIYDGGRPITGGAEGTLLAQLTCGTPFAPAASNGVLSPTLPAAVNASASGQASWFRVYKADGTTFVFDGTIGLASEDDMTLNTLTVTSGLQMTVTGWTITRGNA